MRYREIPGTGAHASAVGYGLWGVSGQWEGGADDAEAIRALHAAIDAGIDFFDTAPVYGRGHAEELLGKALKGRRDKVLVASKCGLVWNSPDGPVLRDVSPASLIAEIDRSLSRLGTDRIDLWQVHWPTPEMVLEETMAALLSVVQAGKVRWLGVSNFTAADTRRAKELGGIVSWQGIYNALERNPSWYHDNPLVYRTERDILPLAEELGLGILPYSPLMQGLLAGAFGRGKVFGADDVRILNPHLNGPESAPYYEAAAAFLAFAAELGKPPAELAINWLLRRPAILSVICGARTAAEAVANARAAEWELNEADAAELERRLSPWESVIKG
jgi:aryl-alcohol dehydrogenase-like predicted oxidoreductase